jgi:hypothetical protein
MRAPASFFHRKQARTAVTETKSGARVFRSPPARVTGSVTRGATTAGTSDALERAVGHDWSVGTGARAKGKRSRVGVTASVAARWGWGAFDAMQSHGPADTGSGRRSCNNLHFADTECSATLLHIVASAPEEGV